MKKRVSVLVISAIISTTFVAFLLRGTGVQSFWDFIGIADKESVLLILTIYPMFYVFIRLFTQYWPVIFEYPILIGIALYLMRVGVVFIVLAIPAVIVDTLLATPTNRDLPGLIAGALSYSLYVVIDFIIGIVKGK